MSDSNPLYNKDLLQAMLLLKEKDPEGFMNLVLGALKKYPDLAVVDATPTENKLRALKAMLEHYESIEGYEDCAFLLELTNQIKDEEDKIRSAQR
jgi:hypothetical protein